MGMAWIDYREAFDSVAHKWISKVLDLFKISLILIRFLRINMSEKYPEEKFKSSSLYR